MTRTLTVAAIIAASFFACSNVRDHIIVAAGGPGGEPCSPVGAARCEGRSVTICGASRRWSLTPNGARCRFRCVTDARGPHCAGPLDLDGGADVMLVDDAGHVENAPAVEVLVLPVATPDDAGE